LESGKAEKIRDQMRQKKEAMKKITARQAGAPKEDGAIDGQKASMVDGKGQQESVMQDREPISDEKRDDQPVEVDGMLLKGDGGELADLPHQDKQEQALTEKTAQGNGDMQ
jgi:hypothetical protein